MKHRGDMKENYDNRGFKTLEIEDMMLDELDRDLFLARFGYNFREARQK